MGVFGTLFGTNDSKDYVEAEGFQAGFDAIWTGGESTNVRYANGEYRESYVNYAESQSTLDSLFNGSSREEAEAAKQTVIQGVTEEVDGLVDDFTKKANHNARTNTFDVTMTLALPGVSKLLGKSASTGSKALENLAQKAALRAGREAGYVSKLGNALEKGSTILNGVSKGLNEANYFGRINESGKRVEDFTTYLTRGVGVVSGYHAFAEWSRQKGVSDQELSEMRTAVAGMNAACAEYVKYSNDIENADGVITDSDKFKAALGAQMNEELGELANNTGLTDEQKRERELAIYKEYTDYYKDVVTAEADTAYINASATAAGNNQETFDGSFELSNAGKGVKDRNGSDVRAISETLAKANGTASSAFTAFFKTINATIIRFCPAIATLEATAVKFVDSAYDWARDTITGKDQVSKYQNATITQIAEGIKSDAMEHLAVKAEYDEAMDNLTHSVSEQNTPSTPNTDAEILQQSSESNAKQGEKAEQSAAAPANPAPAV